jgi:hypothetical protein
MYTKQSQNQHLLFKNISLSLTSVAVICSEAVKKSILAFKDIQETELDRFIYSELFYFFIHLMIKTAENIGFSEFQLIKLRTFLEQTIAAGAAGYFGEDETDDRKQFFANSFINSLHQKENEYEKKTNLFNSVKDPQICFLSLFSELAGNITPLLDKKDEKETILLLVYEVSTKEWARLNPGKILEKIKQNT